MNFEGYIAIGSLIVSFIAVISSFRKGASEAENLDAKTYREYQAALKEAHDNYAQVIKDLSQLRTEFQELKSLYEKSEKHRKALIDQLVGAEIVPITLEDALKLPGKKRGVGNGI